MPVFECLLQRFAFILGGKINDRRSASLYGRPGPCVKIICRHCPCDFQLKMGVSVNETGKQKFPGHIDNNGLRIIKIRSCLCYFLIFNQNVGFLHLVSGHKCPVFQ